MSIDPSKATSQNNSSRTFGAAFVANLALLTIQVGAFIVLKKKLSRIYAPRTELPPPEKRAAELPSGPWRWLPAVIFAPSEDIIRKNGLDAYLFVRFLKLMVWIYGAFTLITWPILLPINSINMPDGGKDGLARLSWSNITDSQHKRYIAHAVLVYIMTFLVFYLIRRELLIFVHARHQFLISRSHSHLAQAKTVLITSMPDELCEEKALRQFCAFVPGGINKMWIYRDQPGLPKLYNDRLKICQQLEKAMVKYTRAAAKAWRGHMKSEEAKAKAQTKSGQDVEAKRNGIESTEVYPLAQLSTVRGSLLNQPLPPTPRHSGVTPTNKAGEIVLNDAIPQRGSRTHLLMTADGEARMAMDMVPRPTHRLGRMPFMGQTVDTFDWCKSEIVRLTGEINESRKGLPQGKPHGSAFVQCNLQMGAHVLAQCVSYHEPLQMSTKWIEVAPDDIIWDNIDDGAYEVRSRYILSWVLTLAVIALVRSDMIWLCGQANTAITQWFIPTAFAGILSNVDQLCTRAKWLAWVCRLPPVVQGIIQGVLPPAFIAILFILLPKFLRAMAIFECIPRHSLVSISLYKRYFLFLLIHGFLTITFTSGITATIVPVRTTDLKSQQELNMILKILEQPSRAVELLAKNLPNASIFFLTYIVANGLAGSAGALAQIRPLVLYFFKKHLFGSTPRQAFEVTFMMPHADFGEVLPRLSLLCTIGLAYSVIAPVINGLAMLAFALYYIAWKFLFLWVYDQPEPQETGGLYFPLVVSNLFVGLYIEQICLAGLFFLDIRNTVSLVLGAFMVILIVITIGVQILFHKSFNPITKFLPMSMATKSLHDRQLRHQKKQQDPNAPAADDIGEDMDLFRRDHLQTLIRRKVNKKLKLPTKPKDEKAYGFAPPAPAPVPGTSLIPDAAPQLATPKLLTRSNSRNSEGSNKSKKSNRSKTKEAQGPKVAPAAPALRSRLNVADDSSSEDDSDLDEFAFDHPNTYKEAPWIWLAEDKLGISKVLLQELHKAKVEASDLGATMDKKGVVEVNRGPPDEAWSGGLDV
ncbi:hypothetical protein CTheo_5492 [Ceratobasidium theobromae]|uniref:Tranport-associated late exocytosis protein n=1 Tax=Ceratobasidium theobromae TaxID=1582974 RepID=A0A5N5QH80_9AGAM|nr:hypothetical protein CTheo_5492 [Ceratobasidium theobromae]